MPALLVLLLMGTGLRIHAQSGLWVDSLKKSLSEARTDRQRMESLLSLSLYLSAIDTNQAEQYARQAIETAELSRDRRLMAMVYLKNGDRFLSNEGIDQRVDEAIDNYRQGERIARENGLEDELVESFVELSHAFRSKGDNEQALQFSDLAVASSAGRGDSIKMIAYISLGDTYTAKNEMLLAFPNYLAALDVAELSKNEGLARDVYTSLSTFYRGIHEYDKAIDYRMKAIAADRKDGVHINLLNDYFHLGQLYEQKQQYDLALKMYETSIALSDTMHFELFKVNSYFNIFMMYLKTNQFKKGVDYINSHPEIMEVINTDGIRFYVDQLYGSAYTDLGRFDSAGYYFRRAEPLVEARAGPYEKCEFYAQVGNFYKKKGDNAPAILYFLKVRELGNSIKSLEVLQGSASNLDTLYMREGDYKSALFYNVQSGQYADSIRDLAREADLRKLGIDNDNRRRERLAREEEMETEHRHNVQYMGFTVGLVALFLALVMLGFFDISPRTIRALGFFSFIFLFEFIILLADRQIHEWTHGEPWKILLIKIGLAAILLPLHHWMEHKVIHYLTSRKKFVTAGISFRKKPVTEGTAPAGGSGEIAS